MIHYRLTSFILALFISLLILYLIRRDHLQPRYAPWWLMTASAIILFGAMPQLVDIVGHKLGAHYPPILLVIVAICLILLKMLKMDIDRSQRERQLRRLAQRLAILESELKDSKNKTDENNQHNYKK